MSGMTRQDGQREKPNERYKYPNVTPLAYLSQRHDQIKLAGQKKTAHKNVMKDQQNSPAWLRPVTEYGPIVIFFLAYYGWGLFVATAAIMGATAIALALSYAVERRVPIMPLITAGIVGVFGGLTLWLQDETFIKMKPTIIQAVFGTVLIGGLVAKRLFLKSLMGHAWHMTDQGWTVLTQRFAAFFFVMALVNEAVWRTQTTDFWVNFKVFGLMGLTLVFVMTQLPLLKKFALEDASDTTPH
jgi:intracellular septation protein